jgi:NCAIR mutase (PurE)-related protein
MNLDRLRGLLDEVKGGGLDVEAAVERLKDLPFEDLPFARFDTHRLLRTGMEEVIYSPGKRPEQMEERIRRSLAHHDSVLATRVGPDVARQMVGLFPQLVHQPIARTLSYRGCPPPFPGTGQVGVVTAGTADLPVAEEAVVTLEHLGSPLLRVTDVGVAGIHRLFDRLTQLRQMSVLVVVAVVGFFHSELLGQMPPVALSYRQPLVPSPSANSPAVTVFRLLKGFFGISATYGPNG